jgi:hypothetical protein
MFSMNERRLLTQRLGHNVDPGLGTEGHGTAVEDSHIPGFAPAGFLLCLVTCTAAYLLQLPVISERKRLGPVIDTAMHPQGMSVLGRIALRKPITRLSSSLKSQIATAMQYAMREAYSGW